MKKIIYLLLFSSSVVFSQQKLKKAKENLTKNTTKMYSASSVNSKQDKEETSKSTTSFSDELSNSFLGILGDVILFASLGVIVGDAEKRGITPYPYFDGGEFTTSFNKNTKRSNFRIGANYLFNSVKVIELNGLYKPIPIVGIEASHLHFSEKNRGAATYLDVSSLLVNYNRFRERYFSVWWGVGATFIGNEVDRVGFTYGVGTEIYPWNPVSIHFSWKESILNNSVALGLLKTQLKVHLKKIAIYSGYHHYDVGGVLFDGGVIGVEYTF
ncbi:hypothetical protein [Tenacibaculum sp. SG-28]|uniref:hypothetical protein n=1 Tax=Tenacibaculum sp. SG-28 TaxID=754426 RepID=UPI000CF3F841|nr:hypothetical protein [Tenacibaculum sp. SG-28]PQJ21614.1 hypothetical protein BSU00_05775 [Tenacibaculum sp. SG-28]